MVGHIAAEPVPKPTGSRLPSRMGQAGRVWESWPDLTTKVGWGEILVTEAVVRVLVPSPVARSSRGSGRVHLGFARGRVRPLRLWHWLWCVLMVVQIAGSALAQEAQPEDPLAIQRQDYRDKAARGLFEAGSVAFEEGRYEEALEHFEQAYELSPNRHLLLYNIASSLDRLRRDAEALEKFQRYLELNPTASNRTGVEARVIVLRKAVEQNALEDKKREEERKAQEQKELAAQAEATQQPTQTQ